MKSAIMKALSLVLVCTMVIPFVACGNPDDGNNGENHAVNTGEVSTEDMDFVCELPSNLDYGDEVIHILYADKDGVKDELLSPELGNGVVSDAVYERNIAVENQLHVVFELIPAEDVAEKVQLAITSNDDSYDLAMSGTYNSIIPALNGYFLDLNGLGNIDTSKHYWTQGYNDMVTFTDENKQFLATGPVAISLFRYMYLTIFNRDLFEANHIPDLYDTVNNGEWTLDYQAGILTDTWVDSDGQSGPSEGDFYGFITGDTISVDCYPVTCGVNMIVKDPDTADLVFNTEESANLIDLVEKVNMIYADQGTYVYKGVDYDDIRTSSIIQKFASKEGLMATTTFYAMETNLDSLKALNYGIAPMPKFSEDQPDYYSYVQDQVSCLGILSNVSDIDRQEMIAAVMESLAYHSYLLVRPAYYDSALSLRFMQDPESQQMLDRLFDTMYFDFSTSCSDIFTTCVIRNELRSLLSGTGPTRSLPATLKSWETVIGTYLDNLNTTLYNYN